jgi:hypothetical protein
MTEIEELRLKIEYLEEEINHLKLRLGTALSYIEYVFHEQKEVKKNVDNT